MLKKKVYKTKIILDKRLSDTLKPRLSKKTFFYLECFQSNMCLDMIVIYLVVCIDLIIIQVLPKSTPLMDFQVIYNQGGGMTQIVKELEKRSG